MGGRDTDVISKDAPTPCIQRGLPRQQRFEHCPPICFAPFQMLEMLQPSKAQLFLPFFDLHRDRHRLEFSFDREDG